MNSLDELVNTLPKWASVIKNRNMILEISFTPERPSGKFGETFYLSISRNVDDTVTIAESSKFRKMPAFCAERHINPGSSFCLYLDSKSPIGSELEAKHWWAGLNEFLKNQEYASKYRKWPVNAQLSHGVAADIQIKMEKIATPLGWKGEVTRAIFRNQGWLAGTLSKRAKDRSVLVNARTPCPRGCLQKDAPLSKCSCSIHNCRTNCSKIHPPILRAKCPNRVAVESIILLEYKRREKEEEFIKWLKEKGYKCCGTMDDCPISMI